MMRSVDILTFTGRTGEARRDEIALEEPLEIRLGHGPLHDRRRHVLGVAMRTPGHDIELAVGLAVAEGLLTDPAQLLKVAAPEANVVHLDLHPTIPLDLARLQRHGYTSSSCGVCGKTSLAALEHRCEPLPLGERVSVELIHALPAKLRAAQPTFARTGGLHAAALFDLRGAILAVREDVGRHNAVDKLVGAAFQQGLLPLAGCLLFVSSRGSFELIQKAASAGIPLFAAVGAPSSLAIEAATAFNVTLLGFVRDGRFNCYSAAERLAPGPAPE